MSSVVTAPQMDNNQDVMSRFSPAATKRHLHKQPPSSSSSTSTATASEKSRKERFQKLSLVGSRSNSTLKKKNPEMGSDDELISMVAAKRFRLPQKFLDDCKSVDHASVPRKLRSAMKKRNAGSISPPPLPNAKKTKHPLRGRESPNKDAVKKIKKQKRLECSTRANLCGSITKDEEEVVETLYALAGMIPNNGTVADSRSRPAEESRKDAPSTDEGTETEELKLSIPPSTPGNEEILNDEASKPVMNGLDQPKAPEQQDLVDSKRFLKSEPSSENLPMGINVASGPTEPTLDKLLPQRKQDQETSVSTTNPEQQHKVEDGKQNGPVLWPGLLTASHNSIRSSSNVPSWLRSSSNPAASAVSDLASDQENGGNDDGSRKKCAVHVYISRMIRTLQNPDSKQRLSLERKGRDGDQEAAKKINVTQNVQKEAVHGSICLDAESTKLQQRRRQSNGQNSGSSVARVSSTEEKQSFDFLSLSTGGGSGSKAMMSQFQVPYHLQSYAQQQQHIPATTLSAPKIQCSQPYSDQLSAISSQQLQLPPPPPPYLGSSSGRSSLHKGGPASEQQHQQTIWTMPIASSQYKQQQPAESRQVAWQYHPGWQNGRVESSSSTVMPFATSFPPPSTREVFNGMKHDLMTQFNNNHNHHQSYQHQQQMQILQQQQQQQQQQQYFSVGSAAAVGPLSLGKRQDHHHHLVHPSVGREETAMMFHRGGGGSLSLQLLCNEPL